MVHGDVVSIPKLLLEHPMKTTPFWWDLPPCNLMLWPCKVYGKTWGVDKRYHTMSGLFDGIGLNVRNSLQAFVDKYPERIHFRGSSVKVSNRLGTVTEFLINPDDGKVEFV